MKLTPKQRFIHFLKQNNVYEQYMFNFNNIDGINFRKKYRKEYASIKSFFLFSKKKYYVYNAFLWESTKEGYNFWNNLQIKWEYQDNLYND